MDFEGNRGNGTEKKGGLYKKGLREMGLGGELWGLIYENWGLCGEW